MPTGIRSVSGPWPLLVVGLGVAGLLLACRALGFGEGVSLGATPASGLALGAAIVLRWRGVIAVAMGVMNLGTYGFTIIAARLLGPREYGAVAALMGLLLIALVAYFRRRGWL